MANVKYYYDSGSSQYKRHYQSAGERIGNAVKVFLLSLCIAVTVVVAYSIYFESPNEVRLKNEIAQLEVQYKTLDQEINSLHVVLAAIEERDDNVYRAVLGTDPIDKAIRKGGTGGVDRYRDIRKKNLDHENMVVTLFSKLNNLKSKLYIESTSQQDLLQLAETKHQQFAAIPAIQPISNRQLTALASGFGTRIHPIYKVLKMHTGIDFASPVGTPVYATADGIVEVVEEVAGGYGKMIIIDHGFGYKTRYAHLNDFAVPLGKKVKRGEQIGYVGNTGVSTAPHLHYEVLLKGEHINPIHYFFNDLNADEYERITQIASIQNQSLGN